MLLYHESDRLEFQQIALNYLSHIDLKDFMNLYRKNVLKNYIDFMLLLH